MPDKSVQFTVRQLPWQMQCLYVGPIHAFLHSCTHTLGGLGTWYRRHFPPTLLSSELQIDQANVHVCFVQAEEDPPQNLFHMIGSSSFGHTILECLHSMGLWQTGDQVISQGPAQLWKGIHDVEDTQFLVGSQLHSENKVSSGLTKTMDALKLQPLRGDDLCYGLPSFLQDLELHVRYPYQSSPCC